MSDPHVPVEHRRLLELLSPGLREPDWASIGVLSALLDNRLLFGEEGLAASQLEPLFGAWWSDRSLVETVDRLQQQGLLTVRPGQVYSVPAAMIQPLASVLATLLNRREVSLPKWSGSPAELLSAFDTYCLQELSGPTPAKDLPCLWGGAAYTSANRTHLLLFRPFPLCLQVHSEHYILLICQWPQNGLEAIVAQFVERPSLRQRVALYDLGRGQKMNLTRSGLFVHFERFLRWTYGLRIVPSPELTQGLINAGLLVLEKA